MPDEHRICRRLVVSGQVQGVFFRDSTRRRATQAGVAGWVTNRPDGTVEALLEGDPEAVELMIDYCRQGPGHAQVDDVAVSECAPEGRTAFEVR
jgi:acylphosphatase